MHQTHKLAVVIVLLAFAGLLAACTGPVGQPPRPSLVATDVSGGRPADTPPANETRPAGQPKPVAQEAANSQPTALPQAAPAQPAAQAQPAAAPQATTQPEATAGAATQPACTSQTQGCSDPKLSSEPRTSQDGAVTIEVTPAGVKGDRLQFAVSLNTHSVDLNYDYRTLATLKDDQGQQYPALGWEGGTGGHHLQGTLSFTSSALKPGTRWLELDLRDIGQVPSRTFRWDVQR